MSLNRILIQTIGESFIKIDKILQRMLTSSNPYTNAYEEWFTKCFHSTNRSTVSSLGTRAKRYLDRQSGTRCAAVDKEMSKSYRSSLSFGSRETDTVLAQVVDGIVASQKCITKNDEWSSRWWKIHTSEGGDA